MSISPLGLFQEAGLVGQLVMGSLFCASVWCWALIVESSIAARRLGRAIEAARHRHQISPLMAPLLRAGEKAAGVNVASETHGDRRWRIGETMTRAARDLLIAAEGGLPNLAVIASVSPFIGLFGTVWGIMTSFAGIADARDTSLAIVAPGIAEALAATAYGLAAAIPASIGYNRIGARFSRIAASLDALVQERADGLMGDNAARAELQEAA